MLTTHKHLTWPGGHKCCCLPVSKGSPKAHCWLLSCLHLFCPQPSGPLTSCWTGHSLICCRTNMTKHRGVSTHFLHRCDQMQTLHGLFFYTIRCGLVYSSSCTFGSGCRPLSWRRSSADLKRSPDSTDVLQQHGQHTLSTDGQLACWRLTHLDVIKSRWQ